MLIVIRRIGNIRTYIILEISVVKGTTNDKFLEIFHLAINVRKILSLLENVHLNRGR
jgi:hypothetical protein